jgi:hypothetical protein
MWSTQRVYFWFIIFGLLHFRNQPCGLINGSWFFLMPQFITWWFMGNTAVPHCLVMNGDALDTISSRAPGRAGRSGRYPINWRFNGNLIVHSEDFPAMFDLRVKNLWLADSQLEVFNVLFEEVWNISCYDVHCGCGFAWKWGTSKKTVVYCHFSPQYGNFKMYPRFKHAAKIWRWLYKLIYYYNIS